MSETPEQLARQKIDAQLIAAGWVVQDYKQFNPSAGRGIALREPPLKTQAQVDELCPALSTEFCGELKAIILTGTGPVSPLKSDPAKVFASAYALGAGVIFITATGIRLTPIFHRVRHLFHIEQRGWQ
jgi:hypothetical protein